MKAAPTRIRDRRAATRTPASGRVLISVADPVELNIEAELIETSDQGFRISHASRELVPGTFVEYSTAAASGRARVAWTHVLEGRHVSGLMILSQRPEPMPVLPN